MWDKITVQQYQQIHGLNKEPMEEVDKTLRIISIVYNLTDTQIENLPVKEYHLKMKAVMEAFSSILGENKTIKANLPSKWMKASGRKYRFTYDVGKMRYGQYTELQYFFSGGLIENLHLICASIANPVKWWKVQKNDSTRHAFVAEDFLQANFLQAYSNAVFFCTAFQKFNKQYKGLFGMEETEGEQEEEPVDEFNSRFGWIYSATQIRDHEKITLDDVFELSVIQAFNDLAYLKALKQYEMELTKRRNAEPIH